MASSLSLPLSNIIPVSVVVSPAAVPGLTFNQGLIVGSSPVIPTVGPSSTSRLRLYESVTAMLEDGFTTTDPETIGAELYFGQTPAPTFLWVGRQNLTAIQTVTLGASGGSGYNVNDLLTLIQSGAQGGVVKVLTTTQSLVATTTASVAAGSTAMLVASASGILVGQIVAGTGIAAGTTVAAITGSDVTLSLPASAALGSTVTVSAATTATGSINSQTLTVASGTGIAVGMAVAASGVPVGATVTAVVSTTVTISAPTTAALNSTSISFTVTVGGIASNGSTSLVVASPTGIANGATITGTGIPASTTVSNITGTTITLSQDTTGALTGGSTTFSTGGIVGSVEVVEGSQGNNYITQNNVATTGGAGTGCQIDITAIGETPVEAIAACRAAQPSWYTCMFVGTAADSDYEAIALFIEAATPASLFFLTSGEAAILNNSANNLFAVLQAESYRRTFMMYSTTQGGAFPNNIYASAGVMGAMMGLNTGAAGSYFTACFKAIAGVSPEPLTQTQVITICGTNNRSQNGLNGNILANYQNGSFLFLQNGTMASGVFFDEVLNLDMLTNDVQLSGMNLLTTQGAIPITNGGVAQFQNVFSGACARAQQRGFIAPSGFWTGTPVGSGPGSVQTGQALPNGFFVYVPAVTTLSPQQRAARQMPPFTILLIEAEAAQSLSVTITVQR